MTCTPINLFVDTLLWRNHDFFQSMQTSYQNLTPGDPYDCGLRSVPCDSQISRDLSFSDIHYADFVFWFDLLVSFILETIVILFALFGNIANIIIFSTHKIVNDSTNFLLLAISVIDLSMCLVLSSLLVSCYLCFFDVSAAISSYNILASQVFHNSRWLSILSLDLVAFLAIQRAAAVFIPFRAPIIFSYRNTKIVSFILALVFMVGIIPFYIYSTPLWIFHPHFNKSISLHFDYRPGMDAQTMLEYQIRYSSIRFVADLCVIILSVSVTLLKLISQSKKRASLQAARNGNNYTTSTSRAPHIMSKAERKVSKMSLTVCTVTFIVYSSQTIGAHITLPLMDTLFKTPIAPVIFTIGRIISGLSRAFNFLLYVNMSKSFRQAFKNMCIKCARNQR